MLWRNKETKCNLKPEIYLVQWDNGDGYRRNFNWTRAHPVNSLPVGNIWFGLEFLDCDFWLETIPHVENLFSLLFLLIRVYND